MKRFSLSCTLVLFFATLAHSEETLDPKPMFGEFAIFIPPSGVAKMQLPEGDTLSRGTQLRMIKAIEDMHSSIPVFLEQAAGRKITLKGRDDESSRAVVINGAEFLNDLPNTGSLLLKAVEPSFEDLWIWHVGQTEQPHLSGELIDSRLEKIVQILEAKKNMRDGLLAELQTTEDEVRIDPLTQALIDASHGIASQLTLLHDEAKKNDSRIDTSTLLQFNIWLARSTMWMSAPADSGHLEANTLKKRAQVIERQLQEIVDTLKEGEGVRFDLSVFKNT